MEKNVNFIQVEGWFAYAVFYCEPEYARYRKTRYFLTQEAAERHCREGNVVKEIEVSRAHMADIISSLERYFMDKNSIFPLEKKEVDALREIKEEISRI